MGNWLFWRQLLRWTFIQPDGEPHVALFDFSLFIAHSRDSFIVNGIYTARAA
jgi:hypothetical protein